MIKSNTSISEVKQQILSLSNKPVLVKLNLGRNKYVTFPATLNGVYPAIFTVCPDDANFLGKTAYSYAEVLCGKVTVTLHKADAQA